MPHPLLRSWLHDSGFRRCPACLRDPLLLAAILAGIAVGIGLYVLVRPLAGEAVSRGFVGWLMFVLVWPVLEEVVFRGLLQGELLRTTWGRRQRLGITAANAVTALVFVAFHFIQHPPLWAASVMVPALVFGYMRDRHHSIYPAIGLHVFYNLVYLLAFTL